MRQAARPAAAAAAVAARLGPLSAIAGTGAGLTVPLAAPVAGGAAAVGGVGLWPLGPPLGRPALGRRAFAATGGEGEAVRRKCRRCGAERDGFAFFCGGCGAVMEADYGGTTHFQLLGLDPQFALDLAEVDQAYKELQKKLHPDRHAQADSEDRELVEVHAAKVNEAVNTLRSPLLRAGYWMELHGVRVLEEDQRMQDAETMMEVMEVSEAIGEAESQAEIDALAAENAGKVSAVEAALEGALGGEDWPTARRLVERLQMLSRLGQRLNEWSPPRPPS